MLLDVSRLRVIGIVRAKGVPSRRITSACCRQGLKRSAAAISLLRDCGGLARPRGRSASRYSARTGSSFGTHFAGLEVLKGWGSWRLKNSGSAAFLLPIDPGSRDLLIAPPLMVFLFSKVRGGDRRGSVLQFRKQDRTGAINDFGFVSNRGAA